MKPHRPGLFRFAITVIAATLALILLGGMVTSLGGGLSVPDWPTTYGYNLFTFPFSRWEGLVFWEHLHRLAGALVGVLTVMLFIWVFRQEQRPWVRWLSLGAVGLVIIQGVMGGLRVIALSSTLAIVHGCVAQTFLCVLMWITMTLSPQWSQGIQPGHFRVPAVFVRWSWALVAMIFIQLVLGAVMRHFHAGLAIPTFPLTPEGTLFPRVRNPWIDIAFAHRFWAAAVALVAAVVISKSIGLARHSEVFAKYALALGGLLMVQFLLGASVIWFVRPPVPTSLHVLNGALVLLAAFALAVHATQGRGSQPGLA
jgi:heme a synthase